MNAHLNRVLVTLLIAAGTASAQSGRGALGSRICAIDMGSNSFRRIIGAFDRGGYRQESFEPRTVGVGDDVAKHGRISDAKLAEIGNVLTAFKRQCDAAGAAPVVAVGTAAFRDAPNGGRVIEIAAKLGIAMEIATERRESELAYLVGSLGQEGHAVIDNGSRTIELVARAAETFPHHVFNLGYRIAYETFFAEASDASAAVRAFSERLRSEAAKAPFMRGGKTLIGVEFTEMAAALLEPGPVEGRRVSLARLQQELRTIETMDREAFAALKRRKDIDRALPRLVVAAVFTELFGYDALVLTERELGTGLIIEAGLKRAAAVK